MAETLSRLAETEKQLAAAQSEIEYLRGQLAVWDENFWLKMDLPTPGQALTIWKKITDKYPRMVNPTDSVTDQIQGMVAAMSFCFTVKKTEKPTTRYDGSWWLAQATAFANKARIPAPRIRSVLLGVIACNDINYTLSNSDLFLDTFGRGEPIDRGAWRKLLAGTPLREPTVINKQKLDESIGHVRVQAIW